MTLHHSLLTLLLGTALSLPAAAQVDGPSASDSELADSDITRALDSHYISTIPDHFTYSLREGWFVEAGLDMTLYNPYSFDFGQVFPKGRTHGINAAFGKQFSREIGLRFRMNWENGLLLFRNKGLAWVGPIDPESHESTNMDKGGAMFLYMDVPISLARLFAGNQPDWDWDVLLIPRAGLGGNLAQSSWSPYVGMGCGFTYRLNNRVSLYSDLTYSGITSEFFSGVPGAGTGMGVGWGFNGIISLHAGVRIGLLPKYSRSRRNK